MSDIRIESRVAPNFSGGDGGLQAVQGDRLGAIFTLDELRRLQQGGYGYVVNGGVGTTPITFAGAYDADGPDFNLHIPSLTTVIPTGITVLYDAVGTEATMEILALASNTGDSTATGTAATPKNLHIGSANTSNCTATVAVDAAGVTDPNAGSFFEFWRNGRPLTDTVATTENDRHELRWSWSVWNDGPLVTIDGNASGGSCLAVYCASQAGTGFIIVSYVEVPTTWVSVT